MANTVDSCIKVTSEKLYYDGTAVLSKSSTVKSDHHSTPYASGAASVTIPSYTYSWNTTGSLPASVFGSKYTGSAVNYQNITHKYYHEDKSTVGSSSSKYQTRKPVYTPAAAWNNGTYTYKYGLYSLVQGSSGTVELIINNPDSRTLQANSTRSWDNYSFSTTCADASAAGTKTGYHFYRWACQNSPYNSGLNTDAELILQTEPSSAPSWTYAAGASWSSSSSSLGDTYKFYPMWVANTYTIKYNANGGTGTMADTSATYNSNVTLRANSFSKTGYSFAGWATSATGSVVYTDGQTTQNLTSTNNGTATLYAVWTPNTYTITFNLKGGKFDNNTNWGESAGKSGVTATHVVTYGGNLYYATGCATKEGYSFTGWWTSTSGGSQVYASNGACVSGTYWSGTGTSAKWIYANNLNVYAQWSPNTYSVTLNKNGGTGGTDTIYRKYGVGWYSNSGATTSITKIPSLPTRAGYTFTGYWNAAGTATGTSADGTITAGTTYASNTTWYAGWAGNSYTVKYNANGGTGTMADQSFTYGVAQNLRKNIFIRTGYAFQGWSTSSTGAKSYSDEQSVSNLTTTANGTVNLYAVWGPVSKVNIRGNWKVISGMKVKIDNEWKTVSSIQVKVGNVWKPWGGFGN